MSPPNCRVLLTAQEAFPCLEQCFLEAEREILGGFRVFDLATRLRSEAARKVGKTWMDLVAHTLARGVAIDFTLSDFDAVGSPEMHRGTWRSIRQFTAAREMAGPGAARLSVRANLHPASVGILSRVALMWKIGPQLRRHAAWINQHDLAERRDLLREMPQLRRLLRVAADHRVQPRRWQIPPLHPVTHHQKAAVFDRKRLFVGGMDLDERRFDTPDHQRASDQTWHDVQLLVEGPVAVEAATHLQSFLDSVAGASPPRYKDLLITLSRRRLWPLVRFSPKVVTRSLADAHHDLVSQARQVIYLETQYFRDWVLARRLARAARQNPDLGLIVILPAAPDDVAFEGRRELDARFGEYLQARCVKRVQKAFGPRAFFGSPVQPRSSNSGARDALHRSPLVYVHAKVSIADEASAIVSSANLNGRSLNWDTEMGVRLQAPHEVRALRERLLAHWLPEAAGPEFYATDGMVTSWRALALQNSRCAPEDRAGFIVPYDPTPAEDMGLAVPGVPEEIV